MPTSRPKIRYSAVQDHISIRIIRDTHIRQPIEPLVIRVINAIGDGIGRHTAHNLGSVSDEGVPVFIGNRVALRQIKLIREVGFHPSQGGSKENHLPFAVVQFQLVQAQVIQRLVVPKEGVQGHHRPLLLRRHITEKFQGVFVAKVAQGFILPLWEIQLPLPLNLLVNFLRQRVGFQRAHLLPVF